MCKKDFCTACSTEYDVAENHCYKRKEGQICYLEDQAATCGLEDYEEEDIDTLDED